MQSKAVTRVFMVLGILALASSVMMAQDSKLPHQSITKKSNIIHEAPAPPPGIVTLYTNLGPTGDTYDGGQGWTISGPDSVLGFDQAIAQPYTPTANSTIKGVQLGLGYVEGGDDFGVAIYSDANGLPGNPIQEWVPQVGGTFGTCCTLDTVTDKDGTKVTAGTQYWIVVGWSNTNLTLYGVWDFTYNQSQGTVAFAASDNANKWKTFSGTQTAYAIYGTTP